MRAIIVSAHFGNLAAHGVAPLSFSALLPSPTGDRTPQRPRQSCLSH
jgi:hypothetical protein